MGSPSIACIGIIGKQNNLLHMSLFEPHVDDQLEFSFILNSSLDIFDMRQQHTSVDQDLGLLHALDERLSVYGWLTNTGIKFVIVVDQEGRTSAPSVERERSLPVVGLRDSDLKPAFRALQTAYVKLLQNPFYNPDENILGSDSQTESKRKGIASRQFVEEVNRIGSTWAPGITGL
ncbi:hypothetical protein McanCB56680_006616 [Microsporum canis]|uniref:Trafficking protein particle complex subunit 2-like protein n=1 Tax=Arthroderma otae (strain ATCC MYA-4605 / CBS 113480) TaxID=554155 RepID=C5FF96_ARTOC|nr:conserved hypothetical protein [Microsporum canis CBS 113480]EEQ28480.1 conserved hypothetical protein [Microsporum canis CBS 113480]